MWDKIYCPIHVWASHMNIAIRLWDIPHLYGPMIWANTCTWGRPSRNEQATDLNLAHIVTSKRLIKVALLIQHSTNRRWFSQWSLHGLCNCIATSTFYSKAHEDVHYLRRLTFLAAAVVVSTWKVINPGLRSLQQNLNLYPKISVLFSVLITLYKKIRKSQEILEI